MSHILNRKSLSCLMIMIMLGIIITSCDAVYEDLRPCRNEVRIKFKYDLNMDFKDYFSRDVKSVDVWAFDQEGKFVWHGSDKGAPLKEEGYYLSAALQPGCYDFVAWCSLDNNEGYMLNSYNPVKKEDLFLTLADLRMEGDVPVSSDNLPFVFNSISRNVTIEKAVDSDLIQDVNLSLTQDSKYINLSVATLREHIPDDFKVSIVDSENRMLSYDNAPTGNVKYCSWNSSPLKSRAGSAMRYNISTSRLMADSKCRLMISAASDDTIILDIPLMPYLLKVKDDCEVKMTDQEYLNRENIYDIELTLNEYDEFDFNTIIYINGWAIVPSQIENQ